MKENTPIFRIIPTLNHCKTINLQDVGGCHKN